MANYEKIWNEMKELNNKLEKMKISPQERANALLRHFERSLRKVDKTPPMGMFERLKNNQMVSFWDKNSPDTITEVVPSDRPWCVEDEIHIVRSLYDCTGQKFTIWIKQIYCEPIKKYLLIHCLGYDV